MDRISQPTTSQQKPMVSRESIMSYLGFQAQSVTPLSCVTPDLSRTKNASTDACQSAASLPAINERKNHQSMPELRQVSCDSDLAKAERQSAGPSLNLPPSGLANQ